MHDRGKSDGPVVPAKPPNKPGHGGGGGGGKGTGRGEHGQRNALRTQSRARRAKCAGSCAPSGAKGQGRAVHRAACITSTSIALRAAYRALQPAGGRGRRRGDVARPTGRIWRPISRICTDGCIAGRTGRSRLAGRTSPSPTGGCGRSGSPRWRTRSSSAPSSRCSTPIYEAGLPRLLATGFGRGAARMMRWTRSRSGSCARR